MPVVWGETSVQANLIMVGQRVPIPLEETSRSLPCREIEHHVAETRGMSETQSMSEFMQARKIDDGISKEWVPRVAVAEEAFDVVVRRSHAYCRSSMPAHKHRLHLAEATREACCPPHANPGGCGVWSRLETDFPDELTLPRA